MGKLFIFIVAIGLAIGLALPSGHSKPAPAAALSGGEITLTRGSTGHFYTDAKVNGRATLHFLVDTGATTVALTLDDASALGLDVDPAEFDIVGKGVGGEVRGKAIMLDSIEVDGKKVENVPAVILEGSDMTLLGQTFLARLDQVQISGDYLTMK